MRAVRLLFAAVVVFSVQASFADAGETRLRRLEGGERKGLFPGRSTGGAAALGMADAVADFSVYPSRPRLGEVVSFLDHSTGASVSWEWRFGDGGSSFEQNPSHSFQAPGEYVVTLRVRGAGEVLETQKTVTVAAKDTGTGSTMTYLLPVVLTVPGLEGTRFSTELTLTNRTSAALATTFSVRGSAGGSVFEQSASFSVLPGQIVQPDVWAFLTSIGMTIPAGDPVASLRIAVEGLGDLSQFRAQCRVTTPPNQALLDAGIRGRFGLAFGATPLTYAADSRAVLYGLQQSASSGARSNVACVNAGAAVGKADPEGGVLPPVTDLTLEIEYFDGLTGQRHAATDVMPAMAPFEWRQLSRPLESRGIETGYAVVSKTAGDAQFLCYAVVNDNVNGDGAFVPMFVDDAQAPGNRSFLPVVLEASGYQTEVSFTNRSVTSIDALLTLVLSADPEQPQYAAVRLKPGEQVVTDNVMVALRSAGLAVPSGSIGSLFIQLEEAPAGGAAGGNPVPWNLGSATARTFTIRQGGKFGLAYGSTPLGRAANDRAFVFGLQQSGTRGATDGTRSNLAVLNAAGGEEGPADIEITYFGADGVELGKQLDCAPCRLQPGEWRQFNAVMGGSNGFTSASGFARIERKSGTDQIFAYGVLNDQMNDDGSFVPMVVP